MAIPYELNLQVALEPSGDAPQDTVVCEWPGLGKKRHDARQQPRLRLTRVVIGVGSELEFLDRLSGQLVALEDFRLGLKVFPVRETLVVDVLDRNDLRLALFDKERRRASI